MTFDDAQLGLPDAARLGKRIHKKLFFENADLSAADRRAFTEDIDTVTWQYTLKPSTINVNAYRDDERDYGELAVVHATLKSPKHAARLAERIHRAIPYPLLLVLTYNAQWALSTAHKRASRAEAGVTIAEDIRTTRWIDSDTPTDVEQAFVTSLALDELPQTDFYALYSAWHQRLIALACARLSGRFHLPTEHDTRSAQRERLANCHQLENEIARLRNEIKKETRFNRQVELNTRIKGLEATLRDTATAL
ncbi:DUF4391 domain-containing protein [Salinisphaera sp.]|uniref:DUF4391 domain-containing protein n=1 Tax=Salinisphaera sp. TaxID=1914330 RepID=UPI000C69AD76|nr:DUF4391 domain-containing protein [Salinisphaera sp.]MBS63036.1 hypothetical protein [Salinisphaera sp.]